MEANRKFLVKPLMLLFLFQCVLVNGCYFFKRKTTGSSAKSGGQAEVLGASLGLRANGPDQAALEALYAVPTTHDPAAVRPDPDTFARHLLLQYREPGSNVAREIGRVDQYRMLLGGANVNFSIVPAEGYDSTSLLADLKVAEELCQSLVAPDGRDHPGWASILPAGPSEEDANVRFLAQRLIGIPSAQIDEESVVSLKAILSSAANGAALRYENYIPVCTTLILDAEALLL